MLTPLVVMASPLLLQVVAIFVEANPLAAAHFNSVSSRFTDPRLKSTPELGSERWSHRGTWVKDCSGAHLPDILD